MPNPRLRPLALVAALLATLSALPAAAADRSQVPARYKWDLTALYASPEAWARDKSAVEARIPELGRFQGKLGDSADTLHAALAALMETAEKLERLRNFASQTYDVDTRSGDALERLQAIEQTMIDFRTEVSYMRPEIIAVGKEKVESFLAAKPDLGPYRFYLENILRAAPHTRTPAEERIVAQAGAMANTGEAVHTIFTTAELPFRTVVLSTGDSVTVDQANYEKYRASGNRSDRLKVFHAFWTAYEGFHRTLGTTLYAQVKSHIFDRDVHHFDSCLADALFPDNIPVQVYHQLVDDVHANLPTLYRYLKLRKRMMGLDTLGYEDLYAPIVKDVDLHYTPEEAEKLVLQAVAPLGPDYVKVLKGGLEDGWVDWLPSTGKATGAYSTIAYGTHPYQLLNFVGNYDDVSTLAHESGHSMHSYLADKTQPYVTHDYATFVAEVASTLNENLLLHDMLDHATDDRTRLFLLGNYLENLRTTLFRQVMFAEFELKIHEMAEGGQTLTGDNMNDLYLGLVRTYYGSDQGICRVDSLYSAEWSYVPHFYYDFYVYQYATSLVASTAIADRIRTQEDASPPSTAERDAYLEMLSKGGSEYPIDLLKEAGVDMTTSAPFQAAMKEMNAVMDRMEAILDRENR